MLDISFILVLLCISAFKLAFILVKEYNQKIDSLKSTQDKLAHLSITDELTKIYNRRYLTDELKKLIDYKVEFTVIMIDIDNFKNINDTYGHSVGDMVLIEISKNLKKKLEPNQILGRIGGEEFLIISKEKYSEKTYHFAEFIRLSTEEIIYPNIEFPVTISLGVCSSKSSTKLDDILIEADRCLYRAKEEGKNKVICYNNDF
jgi:diguanylate cyclase (GGDEF)-like protein